MLHGLNTLEKGQVHRFVQQEAAILQVVALVAQHALMKYLLNEISFMSEMSTF